MAEKIQLYVFDFTLSNVVCDSHIDLSNALRAWCKKFVFQQEVGDSGYVHWQGRVSLIKKRRLNELINRIPKESILSKCHWSVTSAACKDDTFYCIKEDTRVNGPWKDTDPVIVLTDDVKAIRTWRPWQEDVMREIKGPVNTREINVVIDDVGNKGKSILIKYLDQNNIATYIPPMSLCEDMLQACMCLPKTGCYVINLPKAMRKEKLNQLYMAIETIKDGYLYDKRYSYKRMWINAPHVWVFTNKMPDRLMLSNDRWNLYGINHAYELEVYVPPPPEEKPVAETVSQDEPTLLDKFVVPVTDEPDEPGL